MALTNTVMEIWNGSNLNEVLNKVCNRLKVILCNILRGEGGNDKVEEIRGVKHRQINIEKVIRELDNGKHDQSDNVPFDYNQINSVENEEDLPFDNEDV